MTTTEGDDVKTGGWPPEATGHRMAGHAVVAWLLDRKLRRVSLVPGPDGDPGVDEGLVNRDERPGLAFVPLSKKVDLLRARDRTFAEREIMIFLAGAMAEARAAGSDEWTRSRSAPPGWVQTLTLIHGAGMRELPDSSYADRFLGRVEECTQKYLEWLTACTATLLDAYWPLVEALAGRLVERGELTGSEVESVLRSFDRRRRSPTPRMPLAPTMPL